MDIDNFSEEELTALKDKVDKRLNLLESERLHFIDLFCGAGGLTQGLKMAGMVPVLGVDNDLNSLKTYKYNHPFTEIFHGKVESLTPELIAEYTKGKKIHLIAGGPPCQGLSTIREDKNNSPFSFFDHFCRIAEIVKPDYLIFENVTGLVAKKNEYTLISILEKFFKIGYEAQVQILESQKYGVPQIRKRAFFIATNTQKKLSYPAPFFDCTKEKLTIPPITLGEALEEIENSQFQIKNHEITPSILVKGKNLEILKHIPEGKGIRYKQDEEKYLPEHLKLGIDWSKLREGRLRELRFRRLDRGQPAPTINTKNSQYYHPVENRRFTVRELATFQSYPLFYEFLGPFNQQVMQVGNSVPPLLAKALGQEIIKSHFSKTEKETEREIFEDTLKKMRKNAFCYQGINNQKKKIVKRHSEGIQMPLLQMQIDTETELDFNQ